jgi:hypothetical protein
MIYNYSETCIGGDYLKKPKFYDTDLLLEFLGGLLTMKKRFSANPVITEQYNREIEAVKVLLAMQLQYVEV